jgi:hypothetical protein
MTDIARTERLRRLQELRTKADTPAVAKQARRARPASMSRIAAAGLGASLTLSLITAMSQSAASSAGGAEMLIPIGETAGSVVLVPIHRTLYLVSGDASTGNWAATPGASSIVSSRTSTNSQPQVTTNGSR